MINKELGFTGERFIPKINKDHAFYYEHYLRYLFASHYVKGKTVLDLACGTGYGSYLLATKGKAKKIFSVDISPKAIQYAKKNYSDSKINYFVDKAELIENIKDNSIDIFVSFETIEHIKKQDAFLKQVKRVMKDDGILIVSTPNTINYPEGNHYHVKELTLKQFNKLLSSTFSNVKIVGQKYSLANEIFLPEQISSKRAIDTFNENYLMFYSSSKQLSSSEYFIAICSNSKLEEIKPTHYLTDKVDSFDLTDGLFKYQQSFEKQMEEYHQIKDSKIYFIWQAYFQLINLFKKLK